MKLLNRTSTNVNIIIPATIIIILLWCKNNMIYYYYYVIGFVLIRPSMSVSRRCRWNTNDAVHRTFGRPAADRSIWRPRGDWNAWRMGTTRARQSRRVRLDFGRLCLCATTSNAVATTNDDRLCLVFLIFYFILAYLYIHTYIYIYIHVFVICYCFMTAVTKF